MARPTKREREAGWREAERQAWEEFRPKLAAAATLEDACRLFLEQAPREGSPGRRYYSNLGFFVRGLSIPDGADAAELALYAELVERLRLGEELAAHLRRAAKERGGW